MTKAIQRLIPIKADENGNPPSRIHLLDVGHWHTPWHGAFEHTREDLAEMVEHFEAGIGLVDEEKKRFAINYSHNGGERAAAWVYSLVLERDGTQLWADEVEWVPAGAQALKDKEFRYISPEWNPREFPWENPEVEGEFVENVVTGAGLTNIPLFKKLTPIMASAGSGNGDNNKGVPMTLEEIRAKKLEDLTDEEKTFLDEHKAELTDEERTAFGLVEAEETAEEKAAREQQEADDEAARVAAEEEEKTRKGSAKHGLTPEQITQLQADAAAGREAQQELLKTKLSASVQAHIERGALKSDQADEAVEILMASNESQRDRLSKFLTGLPDNALLAGEKGKSVTASTEVTVTDEEVEIAASFGNTREQLIEYKKSQAEG